jgi:ParB-like nuclease domain
MPNPLEPHPLAALFPELPPKELTQLARDIKERGQLEPIVLYKGLILDGRNRYRACQIAGVKPRTEEFNAKATKRSPEEFVLSRNLRRRHLSVGQKRPLRWNGPIKLN